MGSAFSTASPITGSGRETGKSTSGAIESAGTNAAASSSRAEKRADEKQRLDVASLDNAPAMPARSDAKEHAVERRTRDLQEEPELILDLLFREQRNPFWSTRWGAIVSFGVLVSTLCCPPTEFELEREREEQGTSFFWLNVLSIGISLSAH
jgi:hypothetical protein